MITISRQQVRRFLLRHQLLYPSQQLSGPAAIGQVFEHIRLIQYDPLNPCGRNPDLVLQSRIADYRMGDFAAWAQQHCVEGFDKVLCLMLVEDLGYLHFGRGAMSAARQTFAQEHRVDLDKVVAKIRTDGPVPTAGIQDERKVDIGWYGPNPWGKVALETLWRLGDLVIVRDAKGRKQYDIPERVYGDRLPKHQPSVSEHIARRIKVVGLLPLTGTGAGWLGIGLGRQLRPEIASMVKRKALIEVAVEGVPTRFVMRPEDQFELESSDEPEPRMAFIAPLDNLIWDRDMIEQLFGFFYRWEVYVPPAKRQYGYYVLPILYGDRFVGRIEPVLNRDNRLVVKGLWKEDRVGWGAEEDRALEICLEQFANYLRADIGAYLQHDAVCLAGESSDTKR